MIEQQSDRYVVEIKALNIFQNICLFQTVGVLLYQAIPIFNSTLLALYR